MLYGRNDPAGVTVHTLRHTCSSWLAQAGVQERLIASILGHSMGTMTARYTHFGFAHTLDVAHGWSPQVVEEKECASSSAG